MLFLTFPKTLPPREPPEQLRVEYLDSCHCEILEEPCSAREEHAELLPIIERITSIAGWVLYVVVCAAIAWVASKL